MTEPCAHLRVRTCGGGVECMDCARLVTLASEIAKDEKPSAAPGVYTFVADPATLERGRQEPPSYGETHLATVEPKPQPTSGALIASFPIERKGNGKTPAPFPAVQPPTAGPVEAMEGIAEPDEWRDLQWVAGRILGYLNQNITIRPGTDAHAALRTAMKHDAPKAGPAQAAIAAITERERAELEQLRAEVAKLKADNASLAHALGVRLESGREAHAAEHARRYGTALDHLRSFAEAREPSHVLIRDGLTYADVREALEGFARDRAEIEQLRAFRSLVAKACDTSPLADDAAIVERVRENHELWDDTVRLRKRLAAIAKLASAAGEGGKDGG